MSSATIDRAGTRRYRKRLWTNRFNLAMSLLTMAFGMTFLLWILSVLFLNVMSPLNEVHRFVDEAHESSLKVGDLLDILSEPVDRSFRPVEVKFSFFTSN